MAQNERRRHPRPLAPIRIWRVLAVAANLELTAPHDGYWQAFCFVIQAPGE